MRWTDQSRSVRATIKSAYHPCHARSSQNPNPLFFVMRIPVPSPWAAWPPTWCSTRVRPLLNLLWCLLSCYIPRPFFCRRIFQTQSVSRFPCRRTARLLPFQMCCDRCIIWTTSCIKCQLISIWVQWNYHISNCSIRCPVSQSNQHPLQHTISIA